MSTAQEVELSAEEQLSQAQARMSRAYQLHVEELARDIVDAAKRDEMDADEVDTYIHESIDSDGWVIYTHKAHAVLLASSNDSAYFDELGNDGAITDGGINWSALAYMALRADVMEELERLDFDASNPQASATDNYA
jgi:hypothetical protein